MVVGGKKRDKKTKAGKEGGGDGAASANGAVATKRQIADASRGAGPVIISATERGVVLPPASAHQAPHRAQPNGSGRIDFGFIRRTGVDKHLFFHISAVSGACARARTRSSGVVVVLSSVVVAALAACVVDRRRPRVGVASRRGAARRGAARRRWRSVAASRGERIRLTATFATQVVDGVRLVEGDVVGA